MKEKIILVLPLKQEFTLLCEELKSLGHDLIHQNLGRMAVTKVPSLKAVIAIGGLGKAQFALQTQYLLQNFKGAQAVLGLGTGGALNRLLAIGDIVVGVETIEHDFYRKFANLGPPSFKANHGLVSTASKISFSEFSVHFGTIASGDETILTHQRANELANNTKALAVAWEGAGLARSAEFMNVPHLEIRGISDFAGNEAPVEFEQNLKLVMKNLALFVTKLVRLNNAAF